ncbi:MAG: RluA family pseudouridine synthase [Thermodesulfobacteriota bacterium]
MKERHARTESRAPRPGGRGRHEKRIEQPGVTVEGRHAGLRLDLFLAAVFPDLSRKRAKRLIDGRRVAVDGRIEAMASRVLRRGERVSVLMEAPAETPTTPRDLPVLYEDGECLAVLKPPGLPSGPTRDPGRLHAAALAERVAGRKLTLLHRLDKDTSGVLLLGKTPAFSTALLDAFRHRRVEKRYLALVRGRPTESFEVVSHLREGEGDRMLTVRAGGMRAETAFRVLARAREYALVEAAPRTGRTHQIRIHLAQAGCPILGDPLYGGDAAAEGAPVPRQMLHAWTLAFVHPATGAELRLEAPVPADFHGLARAIFGPRLPEPLEGRSSTG